MKKICRQDMQPNINHKTKFEEFGMPLNTGTPHTHPQCQADASKISVGLIEDTAADLAPNANGAECMLVTHRDLSWVINAKIIQK
jgi:hypothetical protein